jgi:CheY-like chemotaxis protein
MPTDSAPSHDSDMPASAKAARPIAQGGGADTRAPQRLLKEARLRTLLYIEDNPANMTLVEELIARRPDLRLLKAVDGILGVALARASRPDVILMDINLPEISGVDALAILREDPATAHIPIVALTGNSMPRDIEFGLEVGFFSYITKPFKIREFMKTLNVAMEFAEKAAGARMR